MQFESIILLFDNELNYFLIVKKRQFLVSADADTTNY